MNTISVQTYTAPADQAEAAPYDRNPVTVDSGSHSITINGGQSSSKSQGVQSVDTGKDLSAYEASDWRSGARTKDGLPTAEINGSTIVKMHGMTASVQSLVNAGVLVADGKGGYAENSAPQSQGEAEQKTGEPQTPTSDISEIPQEMLSAAEASIEVFDQHVVDHALGNAAALATGAMSFEDVMSQVSSASGRDPADVAQRGKVVQAVFQGQADSFMKKAGIDASDLEDFYEFAKATPNKAELTSAVQRQIYSRDMSGYRPLIARYLSSTTPSLASIREAGYPTRQIGQEVQVQVRGTWTSATAAARAGLI